jgi:hypothetical protein
MGAAGITTRACGQFIACLTESKMPKGALICTMAERQNPNTFSSTEGVPLQ